MFSSKQIIQKFTYKINKHNWLFLTFSQFKKSKGLLFYSFIDCH